jgi:hypothetical protein
MAEMAERLDVTFLVLLLLVTLYFLPSIVAVARDTHDVGSVIVVNVFLGWTFLGWVISMASAVQSHRPATPVNVL